MKMHQICDVLLYGIQAVISNNFFLSPSVTKSNGGGGLTKNYLLKPKFPAEAKISPLS